MGENVLVGAGGTAHASTGGGTGHVRVGGGMEHAGTGGGAGHAGAGRAQDMQAWRGRKACERGRGHGTCRCGRKGSGDANVSLGRKGALPAKGSAAGVPTWEAWARAGKCHVVPIKTPLPFGSGWIFGTPQSVGLRIIPSNSQLPCSQTRGNCTARAM